MSSRKPYDLAATAASIAHASHNRLAGMIEDALKMERERCARIAEERIPATVGCSMSAPVIQACEDIADAIRSPRAALERDRSESADTARALDVWDWIARADMGVTRPTLVDRLVERAASYRLGGPSSEHTASLLDEAAAALSSRQA